MKKLKQKKTSPKYRIHKVLPFAVTAIVLVGAVSSFSSSRSTQVLGEKSSVVDSSQESSNDSHGKEKVEQKEVAEPTEAPEPTETPEQEQEHEKQAEGIHQEVQQEIQNNHVEKVEVQPTSDKQGEGKLMLEKTDGTSTEKTVPSSTTSLISVQNAQAGTVSISIHKNGTVTLVNGGITVQTSYPVVIDPKTQSIAIKTQNGVTIINTLPSQALNNIDSVDKPTTIQTATLNAQNGEAYYDVTGVQQRRFLGFIPVNATVETKIDAQSGTKMSVKKPWYLNALGFLYTI